ncbi:MAG: hypothetical protein P4M01_11575 [Acidobacteriota bacterium]|nr:hypothetical protein [Acidobacteriota bacterium]
MKLALPIALAAASLLTACNYTKPVMYLDVTNQSQGVMRNIELTHPTGTVGIPQLRPGDGHQHMTPIGAPCKFQLKFEDEDGRLHQKDFDLGEKCPVELSFDVTNGMQVNARVVKR